MSTNLSESDAFTANVQVPEDSDSAGLQFLLTAFQALANRTKFLNTRGPLVAERTFVISPFAAKWSSGWTPSDTSLLATTNSATLRLPLDFLPSGSVLKRVRALVTPGAPGVQTMTMDLYTRTVSFTGPSAGSNTGIELGVASSSNSLQVLTTSLLSETINRVGGKNYAVHLTACSSAGSNNDTLWGFQIVADVPAAGGVF